MQHGPFDIETAPKGDESAADARPAFGEDQLAQLMAEASRTWDVLKSDIDTDWRSHKS
ncbi:MAG TPA: hypothetical protein VKU60_15505 [Chloroflexota bacterium]|nr:hypothetical protein [Chloroflexota bacterium]